MPEQDGTDLVSVIIPARNEAASIEACLTSILQQQGIDLEIIVVDNGSTDATAALVQSMAERDPRIVLVHQPLPSIPATLNAGLAVARGRWLVRVDAHATISPGYIARATELLRSGSWVGVGGRKDAVGTTKTGRAIAAVLGSRVAVGGSTYHHGTTPQEVDHIPFGVYPTDLVKDLGGWDESILNNEDFELDQRLRQHGALWFDPSLQISWACRETLAALWRQYRRYGTGKPAVALAHPSSVRARHLAPPALVLWLGAAAALAPRAPAVAGLAVAPYLATITAASVVITAGGAEWRAAGRVAGALVVMQVSWGVGFWTGMGRHLLSRRG